MVNIEGKYYMDNDAYNYILKEYKGEDKAGKEFYKVHGYFRKPEEALEKFTHLKVSESTASTLKELSQEIKDIKEMFEKQFSN